MKRAHNETVDAGDANTNKNQIKCIQYIYEIGFILLLWQQKADV